MTATASATTRPRRGGSRLDGEVGIDGLERGLEPGAALGQHAQQQRRRGRRPMQADRRRARATSASRSLGATRCSDQPRQPAEHGRRRQRGQERVREEAVADASRAARSRAPACRRGTPRCGRGRAPRPWRCRSSKVSPPTTITAAPTSALAPAMSAGVRLSPSAYERAREEQERAVGEEPDAERRERGGEEVGIVAAVARPRAPASPAARARRTPRSPAAAVATCRRAPTGSDRRTTRMSPAPASRVSSGRIVVWIGCARIAYGARNATKQNWYATTPPATWLPMTIAAPSRTATSGCSADPRREPEQPTELAVDRAEGRRGSGTPTAASATDGHADEADDAERARRSRGPASRRGEVEIGRRARA